MNRPKKIQRYRNLPSGSVLEIPHGDQGFAYICKAKNDFYWLYDFLTDRPLRDDQPLSTTRWKLRFLLFDDPPKTWRLAALIKLTEMEGRVPPMWGKIHENSMHYDVPTFYQVYSPESEGEYRPYYYITEEETKTTHPSRGALSEEILAFIDEFRPELERSTLPSDASEDSPLPEVTLPPQDEESERPILEVQFPCDVEDDLGMEFWQISDEFDEALNDRELGLATSVDSGFSPCEGDEESGFSAEFCVVLDIEPGQLKKALTRIRRLLKRLKAPPTTRIVEIAEDGNIIHPSQ